MFSVLSLFSSFLSHFSSYMLLGFFWNSQGEIRRNIFLKIFWPTENRINSKSEILTISSHNWGGSHKLKRPLSPGNTCNFLVSLFIWTFRSAHIPSAKLLSFDGSFRVYQITRFCVHMNHRVLNSNFICCFTLGFLFLHSLEMHLSLPFRWWKNILGGEMEMMVRLPGCENSVTIKGA